NFGRVWSGSDRTVKELFTHQNLSFLDQYDILHPNQCDWIKIGGFKYGTRPTNLNQLSEILPEHKAIIERYVKGEMR
ncbi:MAG: hypothetical protein U9R53_08485, partial [Chloroflexota bacterium]|nr:hypothetical protein [Chloroflexota bacterium]